LKILLVFTGFGFVLKCLQESETNSVETNILCNYTKAKPILILVLVIARFSFGYEKVLVIARFGLGFGYLLILVSVLVIQKF